MSKKTKSRFGSWAIFAPPASVRSGTIEPKAVLPCFRTSISAVVFVDCACPPVYTIPSNIDRQMLRIRTELSLLSIRQPETRGHKARGYERNSNIFSKDQWWQNP